MPFDGESYYCDKCGKAGYKSEQAVRGHKAGCGGEESVRRELEELSGAPTAAAAAPLARSEKLVQSSAFTNQAAAAAAAAAAAPPTFAGSSSEYINVQRANARLEAENRKLRMSYHQVAMQKQRAVKLATNHTPHLALGGVPSPNSNFFTILLHKYPHMLWAFGLAGFILLFKLAETGQWGGIARKVISAGAGKAISKVIR